MSHPCAVTYRGCFDGWLGGVVDSGYAGCRFQQYLGERVEWCFCSEGNKKDLPTVKKNEPCNGASVAELRRLSELQTGWFYLLLNHDN